MQYKSHKDFTLCLNFLIWKWCLIKFHYWRFSGILVMICMQSMMDFGDMVEIRLFFYFVHVIYRGFLIGMVLLYHNFEDFLKVHRNNQELHLIYLFFLRQFLC